jgi:hypothetical protein
MRTLLDTILERGYWISQIILMIVASIAAIAAFLQLRTFKLFELLKFLESQELRKSRRVVIQEMRGRPINEWMNDVENGKRLEQCASDVCASYDILGRMIEFDGTEWIFPQKGYGSFYQRHWARSIIITHDILGDFLEYRRAVHPEAYQAYSRLAKKCSGYVQKPAVQAL